MTLHIFIPDSEKEKEKRCGLKIVSSNRDIVDLICEECNYHISVNAFGYMTDCKKGRERS